MKINQKPATIKRQTQLLILCLLLSPMIATAELFQWRDVQCTVAETNCLRADFDGNGIDDFSAPLGEGWIYVVMNRGTNQEQVLELDAGGVTELYPPRDAQGPHGEPVVANTSIVVRWVGQHHVVLTWDGNGFTSITYPAQ